MARRPQPPSGPSAVAPGRWKPRPFAELRRQVRARAAASPRPPAPTPPAASDEPALFARAMADVVPLAPETRERVEGMVVGLDPRLVRRLRRGDFAWQAHLDLHGMTAAAARTEVERFLLRAVRAGHRCVLIVHGRGLNSKDRTPVLKERLKGWLSHGALARSVLAFASARPCDGGAGALYVLLRRDRRRRAMLVREGAKR